ncbi:SDR family NAD(P)-dependent oxidoreductase [Evansella tamaricis]|uniref:SDR family NAD(P)-dependent oxidoreductase n=1 Tax=Evansella tamaricis TaxID=2069301 RepID=A0ABS6JE93_9BACI|nr:SDR family NAD(P)-dependent oxidoreductase [Evansella tamaricis]
MEKKRIVIITGANSGIGKAAATLFASNGFTVIMACRNLEKSEKVQKKICSETNNPNVKLMELDMSSFTSIQAFSKEFQACYSHLDILIHNAAYFNHGEKYRLSPDNVELTFATNVIGPYLLTDLLLGHLKNADDPRILHASSNIVKQFFDPMWKINFDQIIGEIDNTKGFSVYKMYAHSKMALVMLTFRLAEEWKGEGIKVNALQINGAKMSKETLQKVTTGWRAIARIQNLFFPPPEKMASIYYDMCTSEEFRNISGKLINDKKEVMNPGHLKPNAVMQVKQLTGNAYYPPYADQKENQEQVWYLCQRALKEL